MYVVSKNHHLSSDDEDSDFEKDLKMQREVSSSGAYARPERGGGSYNKLTEEIKQHILDVLVMYVSTSGTRGRRKTQCLLKD